MSKKIIIEHIPRTIFGVKYDYLDDDRTIYKNNIRYCDTKNEQLKVQKKYFISERYSEVKLLKWLIKPE